jgi:cyclohexanecarboxyl-CoA dehydrogenase
VTVPSLPGAGTPAAVEAAEVATRLELGRRAMEIDRDEAFPRDEFHSLGQARWLGLLQTPELGGRGWPLSTVGVALFHLAYHGGTAFAKLSLQPEFSSVLAEHGSPALVERYFGPLLRGELLIGNHVTEPGAGSDLAGLACRAQRVGDEYEISGTKSEAAFAPIADAAIVYARIEGADPRAVSAFVVPQSLRGVARRAIPDLGERWMQRGEVRYDHVRIPADHRIGEEGLAFDYLKTELTRERALLAAIYLGVARASWDDTVVHVGGRTAFGRALSTQEAVGFPLVEDWARMDAAWLYTSTALARLERGEPVDAEAALAKWMAVEVALETIDHAIQFHGGSGYSGALPHERRWRDVRSGRLAHGTSEIMRRVAGRELWSHAGDIRSDGPR